MAASITLDTGGALTQLPPLSLYVHLPWCLKKCPYCDFNSHEWRAGGPGSALASGPAPVRGPAVATLTADQSVLPVLPVGRGGPDPQTEAEYVDALQADLEAALPLIWGRSVQTVFIGGGTPSLFSPAAIDRLLAMIRARLRLAPAAEITMEANPGTFERERFRAYAEAGVNRLSIGVQSFDDRMLEALGRVHDGDQARRAIETAAQCYPTFNIDLMYALPGQDLAALDAEIATALAFAPPHLSWYHLTIEPNTLFARFPPTQPDDDTSADMQQRIEAALAVAGLEHYEVSAYARAGHRSQHNLNYWEFGDYLGIGAGAHSKLSFHDRIVRQARYRHPRRYVETARAGQAVEDERRLTRADLPFEFMLNALRLVDGVPVGLLAERTGLTVASIAGTLREAVDKGLLDADPTVIRPTPLGARFLNDLQAMFL
ncbi:MAG: radical SAM family heme chaperone HemW [Burkholderiaceae bacterium]